MKDDDENIIWSSFKDALGYFFAILGAIFIIIIIHVMLTHVDSTTYNVINNAISKLDEIKNIAYVINLIK